MSVNLRFIILLDRVRFVDLDTSIKCAIDGKALLILGAGFSVESKNVRGEYIPTASKLVDKIYSEIYHEDNLDDDEKESLEELSDRCIKEKHSTELCQLLRGLFTQQAGSTADDEANAAIIMNLPWRRIYTTNYDNVAENYSSNCGRVRTPVMLCDDIKEYASDDVIVHLNGYIQRLTNNSLGGDFKLSASSYLIDSYQRNDWIKLLKSDIDAASAVVLVGVSGSSDLDLKRLIYNEAQYHEKLIFVDVRKKRYDIRERFGSIYIGGLSGLACGIKRMKEIHQPVEDVLSYSCFEKLTLSQDAKQLSIDSTMRRNMLEKGVFDADILAHHIQDNEYLFWRKEILSVEDSFDNDKARCICVTSRLANGKTCFIQLVSAYLLSKEWDVFVYQHDNVHLHNELDSFRASHKKTLIVVESYHLYFYLLEKMQRVLDNAKVYILLSSRTGIHVSVCQRLSSALAIPDEKIQECNLDVIDSQDLDNFIRILEKGDYLLGERNKSLQTKRKLLQKKCHSCVSEALITYVQSKTVKKRIDESCRTLSENSIAQKIAYSSLILLLLNVELTSNELFTVLDISGFPQSAANNTGFKDLIDFQNGKFHVHSTVFARYVVSKLSVSDILDYMISINENADKLFSENKTHAIRSSFVTYSNINLLIPPRERTSAQNQQILEYYYNLGQLKIYDENPFFWLQYAIVSMDVYDYKRAAELISMAYSCASKKNNFDTFQIDTQNGRLILERVCDQRYKSEKPFDDFMAADASFKAALHSTRGTVRQVIRQVVKGYPEFFAKYKCMLTTNEKNFILKSITAFMDAAHSNNVSAKKGNRKSEIIHESELNKLGVLKTEILSL